MGLVTLTFDLFILKVVWESHQRWGTFPRNLGTLGLRVLELFTMYETDGQTDRQTDGRTDKRNPYFPLPYGQGIIKSQKQHAVDLVRRRRHWYLPHSSNDLKVKINAHGASW